MCKLGYKCFFLAFAGVLLAGCGNDFSSEKSPGVYVNDAKRVNINALKAKDAILIVNGEKITKQDYLAEVVLKDALWRLRKDPSMKPQIDYDAVARDHGQWIVYDLMRHAMFRQYAKKIKANPAPEAVEKARAELMKSLKKESGDFQAVADYIGGDAAKLFMRIPFIDAQDAMLRQSITTNDLDNVSEAELQERQRFVDAFDANADAMNAKAAKRLMEAKAEILAGADFAAVTKRYAEVNPQYGEMWGTFELPEMAYNEDLHKWLATAKAGDISDPVDVEDGIAIVKVVAKGQGEAPPGMPLPDNYTLIRCTLKACERMRFQDRAEMTRQLLLWKRQDAQKELGEKLLSEAVIEYPNGTNLFIFAENDE